MATIGSAKATLVNKIDTLTASATAKDTIYLAKALKENTTHHSFTFQGAWAATTAYALDDVVTTSGKTYICILAYTSGASFAVGSNWSLMAEKGTDGTDGTDLTSTLTTAGDVVYKGASALTRLAKGTASQVLTMNSGATAPEWSDAAGGGKVLQVLSTPKLNIFSTTSSSWTDVTGLSVAITPSNTSSKILIQAMIPVSSSNADVGVLLQVTKGDTEIFIADQSGSYRTRSGGGVHTTYGVAQKQGTWMTNIMFLDSPSTTSSITYKIKAKTGGGTMYIGKNGDGGDDANRETYPSSITVMEIGA